MPALSLDVTRGIAHEFNNVLMAIAPFAELIARKPDDPRVSEYARNIHAAVSRGSRITQDLISRASTALDVVDVGNMLQSLAAGSPRTEIRPPSAPLFCAVSTDAFRQAAETLVTLLAGSGEASRLIISAELALDHPHATGEAPHRSQELVHIKFRSEGFSLRPSDLPDAIAMTRDLIRDSGGQMMTEQCGTGSVIHFFFVGHQQRTSAASQRQQGASLERVLVVDDDELVADAVSAMLDSADIAYDVVHCASDVLQAIERTNPDVVLLDVHLGDADGRVIFRDIIDRWPGLPVVFSTGHASSVDLADVVGAPLVRLLQKPYSTATLIQALREVVAAASETEPRGSVRPD